MRKLQVAILAAALAGAMSASGALTWNMGNAGDYFVSGSATVSGGQGTVTPQLIDEASILAKINTQAYHLNLGDITGGGYTINSFSTDSPGTPSIVYGSLYLSPSGGSGSDVLILLSPMTVTGSGTLTYTFDLNTHADYRTRIPGETDWSAYDPTKSGTFGQVIGMLSANSDYAAFFGPQIGMSGTSDTAFNVTQIQLVPEPTTMIAGALLLLPFGASTLRILRKRQMA